MNSKVRISMKFKILALMIAIILSSLGAYLYFALDLFNKDKNAYIFDSGLATAESMGDQLLHMINHNAQNSFTLSLIGKNEPEILEEIIAINNDVMMFSIYQREAGSVKVEKRVFNERLEDLFGVTKESIEKIDNLKLYNSKTLKEKELLIENTTHLVGYPSMALMFFNKDLDEYYLTILSIGNIIDQFAQGNIYENFLFDNRGRPYFLGKGPTKESYVKKILKGKVSAGSKEVKSKKGEVLLVSFRQAKSLNFNVISSISKSKAFSANKSFIFKTVVLGVFLISTSILLGYLFSTGITSPIQDLVKGTEEVAAGNYENEIKVDTADELKILSESFNFMSAEISKKINELKDANAQLEDYSQNLEKMVDQRTKELKEANTNLDAMINSLGQGLFVFDNEGQCGDIYTKACEDLFDTKPNEQTAYDVLGLTGDAVDNFTRWTTNLFKETIPFEHLVGLGPKSVPTDKTPEEEGFHHIGIEYFPIRSEEGKISKVVTVATDKTAEILNQIKFENERAAVERIMLLVENKQQFLAFIGEFKNMLSEITHLANSEDPFAKVDSVMASLHSMKGGSGLFALKEIYEKIHIFEDELLEANKLEDPSSYIPQFQANVIGVTELFDNFLNDCKQFIGEEVVDGKHRVEFKLADIEEFKREMDNLSGDDLDKAFSDMFLKEPIFLYFKSYSKLVQDLATRLGKNIKPINFVNADLKVEYKRHKEFFNMLVHVFRNSVDHGIEDEMTRVTREKHPEGEIKVEFSTMVKDDKEYLSIEVTDDGNGINVEKIREIMIGKGKEDYIADMNDDQIKMLIFDPNLSTAETVSDISGRGVGMSAVRDLVQDLGGHIYLKSELEKGTQFKFIVPNA